MALTLNALVTEVYSRVGRSDIGGNIIRAVLDILLVVGVIVCRRANGMCSSVFEEIVANLFWP